MAYMSGVMLYCGGWCPHERGRATTGVMSPLSRAGDTVWTNRIPPPSDQSQRGAGILNILSPVQVIVRGIGNIFELMNCHSTAAHCATSHGRDNGIGIEKSILGTFAVVKVKASRRISLCTQH